MRSLAKIPSRAAATLGLFVLLAGCTAGSGGCSPVGTEGSTTTVPETSTTLPGGGTTPVVVDALEVELCFSPVDGDTFVDEVLVINCNEPHTMEVFAQYELDATDDYPGGSELTWAAQDECQNRFEGYVGGSYWSSDYDFTTLTPSYSTWDTGDRTVTCLIVSGDGGPLTSSAKGAEA